MTAIIRYVTWAVIAALVIFMAWYYVWTGGFAGQTRLSIGGPFTLTTDEGKRLSNEDLKGKPFAIYFGFTYCPDVCPTTLVELTETIETLGPDADKLRYLFVSVDPERDTPEQLKLYLSSFDEHFTGLTGTAEEIAEAAKAYRVYYERVEQDDDYTMNHSALIYLMDGNGKFMDVIPYGAEPDERLQKIRKLIGSG